MASHGAWSKGLGLFFCVVQVHALNIIVPNHSINVGVGMSALLLINHNTDRIVYIIWTHSNETVARYNGSAVIYESSYLGRAELFPANGTLRLDNVNLSDTGSYHVEVRVNSSISDVQNLSLTVHAPVIKPIVYFNPSVPAEDGQCRMECNTPSSGIIKYTWKKDGKDFIPTDKKFTVNENGRVIINVKSERSDIGSYTCTAADQFTEAESDPEKFNIIYGPVNLTIKINGEQASGEHSVDFGEHIILEGQSKGYPEATYRWEKNGSPFGDGVLNFTADLLTEGPYRCTATNANNSKNDVTSLALRVSIKMPNGDPTCTSSSDDSQSLVSLICKWPNGKPPGNLSWTNSMGTQLSAENFVDELTLHINATLVAEQQSYNCQATHYQNSSSCAIQFRSPEIHMEDITVKAGSGGTLKCIVTAEPKAAITWIDYRGEEINSNTEDHEIQNNSLLIKRAESNETMRTYICLASNIFGTKMVAAIVIIDRVNMTIAEIALTVLSSVLLVTVIGLVIFVVTKKISCSTETGSQTQEVTKNGATKRNGQTTYANSNMHQDEYYSGLPIESSRTVAAYTDLEHFDTSKYECIQNREANNCEKAMRPLPRVPTKI